jgi:glyoxylase-like metal-dependent hydrolase (beta-lactamase superfamily II)
MSKESSFSIIESGSFYSDAGAALGILPKAIWQKIIDVDDKNRTKFVLRHLVIKSDGKNILVDTGVGNCYSDKEKNIFKLSEYKIIDSLERIGLNRFDIDYVILTHLHFDHAGGIITKFESEELTFPNALHVIQEKEWLTAKYPNKLNVAAYNFSKHLSLLESSDKLMLIDGDYYLTDEVKIELIGGHSNGFQIVKFETDEDFIVYPADIIPSKTFLHESVTSAYDVNRTQSFYGKLRILEELKQKHGKLIYNHDSENVIEEF